MKTLKKLLAIVVSVMMVLSMTVTAFAATITVTNNTGHSYAAYQIFAGTQAEGETTGALAVSDWGSGINDSDFLTALKEDTIIGSLFQNCSTAADVANILSRYDDNADTAMAFAALAYDHKTETSTAIGADATSVELDAGYYLIVDTTETSGEDDYKNLALLQVTGKGDITIEDKSDKPTVEKKVWEESLNEGNGKYNDVADYDIGDDIPFQLTGTMPSDIASYDSYKYIFHDKMDDSLSFNANSVEVTIDGKTVDPDDYDVKTTGLDDGCTFEVAFEDILSVKDTDGNEITISASSTVVVTFTAKLTSDAKIGLPGQINKVKLEYSNDVNVGGSGETGETPWDTVIVFTYELDITKTNADGSETLKGAEFQIKNSKGEYATFDSTGKVTGWTTDATNSTTILTTPDNGKITVIGLDEGTYTLIEKTAPDGYVVAADKTLVITASTGEVQNYTDTENCDTPEEVLTSLTLTVDGGTPINSTDPNYGIVATNITNTKGGALPETGGIGTTIFYVVGGVLVVAAGVLLITKKRMGSKD